jgi:gliding motility-associated-like protein
MYIAHHLRTFLETQFLSFLLKLYNTFLQRLNSRNSFLFGVFFLGLTLQAWAQPSVKWERTYGGDYYETFNSSSETSDGGYLLAGATSSGVSGEVTAGAFTNTDYWLLKIDTLGNIKWNYRLGGSGTDICYKVIQNDRGFLIVGSSNSPASADKSENSRGGLDYWLVQINPLGIKIWDKTYGGVGEDWPLTAIDLKDGTIVVAGHSDSPAGGDKTEASRGKKDFWVMRLNLSDGSKIWDKTYGGVEDDNFPSGLTRTLDDNIALVGESQSNAGNEKTENSKGGKDVWLIKMNKNGEIIWDKTYGGAGLDEVTDIQEVADGSLFLACNSQSDSTADKTSNGFGGYDYWLIKVDANGRKIWDKTFGGGSTDLLREVDQNKTGYILLAGLSNSVVSGNKEEPSKGALDFWLLYLDENGNKIWEKVIGGAKDDVPFDMVRDSRGNYLVCGLSDSDISGDKSQNSRGTNDFWVAKIECFYDLNLGANPVVCKSQPVFLDATIPNCTNCLYEWSTGERTPTVVVFPRQTGEVKVKVTESIGCEFGDKVVIQVIPSPDSARFVLKQPVCTDDENGTIALDKVFGGTPPFNFFLNTDTLTRFKTFANNKSAGSYQITVVDKAGCSARQTVTLTNPSPFELYISPPKKINLGETFQLTVTGNHKIDTFFWSNPRFKTLDTLIKPFDSETYGITAIDSNGCIQKAATQVFLTRDNLYFAPNVFSPNNDGENELFKIYGGSTVVSIDNLEVFNRWGEMVYSTARIFPSDINTGWDGTFRNKNSPPATYLYQAVVEFIDGRKQKIEGTINLLK